MKLTSSQKKKLAKILNGLGSVLVGIGQKFNPNHGADGRFSSGGGGGAPGPGGMGPDTGGGGGGSTSGASSDLLVPGSHEGYVVHPASKFSPISIQSTNNRPLPPSVNQAAFKSMKKGDEVYFAIFGPATEEGAKSVSGVVAKKFKDTNTGKIVRVELDNGKVAHYLHSFHSIQISKKTKT